MNEKKETPVAPEENTETPAKSVDWKKEHNQKRFYDPITFKGIKIGYTGELMDDENIPF